MFQVVISNDEGVKTHTYATYEMALHIAEKRVAAMDETLKTIDHFSTDKTLRNILQRIFDGTAVSIKNLSIDRYVTFVKRPVK